MPWQFNHKSYMKKTLLLLSSALAFFVPAVSDAQEHLNCGTHHAHRELFKRNPQLVQEQEANEARIQEYIRNHQGERDETVYTIPVVFHIVHQWGEENISDAQIFDQVRILNEDYSATNADLDDVVTEFQDLVGTPNFQFKLATIDPNGNCTDGIDRIASTETYAANDFSKLNPWPREKYLNVWVVKEIGEAGVAGYAYYPSGVSSEFQANIDGVIILHDYIGSIGTGTPGRSRALTHEIGHWLNLSHPWGNTNDPGVECGDDNVTDTPETIGWQSCNLSGSVCNPPIVENVQNYMEYAYCSNMFTIGQVERMRAAAALDLASRSNLWSAENLAATGTDGITDQVCAPEADFYPERPMVCSNDAIRFYDNSLHGQATSWSWTFQDGNPSTSTNQNPMVSFTSSGWKQVSLTASNAQGESSKTIQYSIYVSDDTYSEIPGIISEDFENVNQAYLSFLRRNPDNNNTRWEFTDAAGLSGTHSAFLNAFEFEETMFYIQNNDRDELITPSMNWDNVSDADFTFAYAYATQAANLAQLTERLEVATSINCGETWTTRLTLEGGDLVTAGNHTDFFIPDSGNDWNVASFNISNAMEVNNILVKFTYYSSEFSNNLYIDNINVVGTVGVDELGNPQVASFYPNPSTGNFTVGIFPGTEELVDINIYDAAGRMVHATQVNRTVEGNQRYELNLQHLAAGTYTARVATASQVQVAPIMITK